MPSAIDSISKGLHSMAKLPPVSGAAPKFETRTGVPHAMDSRIGKPKPSIKVGKTKPLGGCPRIDPEKNHQVSQA